MPLNGRELAEMAERALPALPVGTEFKLVDLVEPAVWADAPVGTRRAAGTAFLKRMRSEASVACLGRDLENHQRYQKTA